MHVQIPNLNRNEVSVCGKFRAVIASPVTNRPQIQQNTQKDRVEPVSPRRWFFFLCFFMKTAVCQMNSVMHYA